MAGSHFGLPPSDVTADLLEDEGHLHVDPPLGDHAVIHDDALFLNPRTGDVLQGLTGTGNANLDGVFETLGGTSSDLGYFGYGHRGLLSMGH